MFLFFNWNKVNALLHCHIRWVIIWLFCVILYLLLIKWKSKKIMHFSVVIDMYSMYRRCSMKGEPITLWINDNSDLFALSNKAPWEFYKLHNATERCIYILAICFTNTYIQMYMHTYIHTHPISQFNWKYITVIWTMLRYESPVSLFVVVIFQYIIYYNLLQTALTITYICRQC